MSISLKKGQKISLSKDTSGNNTNLTNITVGLGWDPVQKKAGFFSQPQNFDCDASVLLLRDSAFVDSKDLIYFGNLKHFSGSVIHTGDNITGDGDGDDEQILVKLDQVPEEYNKIVFVVNIYDCIKRKQHFGQVKNAFIRIFNSQNNVELCKFELSENYDNMTTLIVGEIYRNNGEWKFNPQGQATTDEGLKAIAKKFMK